MSPVLRMCQEGTTGVPGLSAPACLSGITADYTCPSCGADSFVTLLPSGQIQLWRPSALTAAWAAAGATSPGRIKQTSSRSVGMLQQCILRYKLTMLVTSEPHRTQLTRSTHAARRRLRKQATNGDGAPRMTWLARGSTSLSTSGHVPAREPQYRWDATSM